MPLLFSYGSLRQPAAQLAAFGRLLHGAADALPGYATVTVSSNGHEHANAVRSGAPSTVAGMRLDVTDAELARADVYEAPDGYARIEVTLESGHRAWMYTFSLTHVRAAHAQDVAALTRVWHDGWHDAHAAIVPAALVALKTAENFHDRLRAELHAVRVVAEGDTALGFAMLRGAEVFQFYVARSARGTGAAALLMRDAEDHLAASGVGTAWLACAVGNTRAARFYEKCGWTRAATVTIESETSIGAFPIEVWKYEKTLR
jgi:ribosomal protein S18 acetylase RimI-like enzyme